MVHFIIIILIIYENIRIVFFIKFMIFVGFIMVLSASVFS